LASAVNNGPPTTSPQANASASAGPNPQSIRMTNPVAHEVRVIATGARPGESAAKRELFTEETSTVLVFQNGAVIRLEAAVIQGQLLFLTNQESKREVVAQVTRMRVFRPTNCYVELEFTEPSPGFWGIEFPEAPELVPATTQQSEAVELVQSAEVIANDTELVPATPSVDAVAALKNEVEALREQLKLLQTQAAERPPVGMTLPRVSADAAASSAPRLAETGTAVLQAAAAIAPAPDSEVEAAGGGEEASFSEEELLPKPELNFEQGKQAAKRSVKLEMKGASGGASNRLRTGLLAAALVLIALGGAWYENWIPGMGRPNRIAGSASPQPVRAARPAATVATAASNASGPQASSSNVAQSNPDGQAADSSSSAAEKSSGSDTAATQAPASEKEVAEKPAQKTSIRERLASVMSLTKHSSSRSNDSGTPAPVAASVGAPAEESAVVPPKLIKSVRPNPPAEALRGFISGNVNVDAVVDVTGRVKSMKVVSGPAALHNAALEALKEYRYEPATQRGKPVPAHVNVTVQFWYEP